MSTVGHPLLTSSAFAAYVSFRSLPVGQAVFISVLLIGGVAIPISIQNYRKVKRGAYTNFDVSDRRQRSRFYPIVIGLVALATGLFVVTRQPWPFCYGMGALLVLLVVSYGANFFVKASLHTSLSVFLAWSGALINQPLGLTIGVLALLIAISRLILKRHMVSEVLTGALIGLAVGAGLYWLVSP